MRHDQIPRFDELSEALMKRTGWQVVAVPGLVPDEVFFEHLAHRRFPAGQFIRRPDELDYLQEPDIFRRGGLTNATGAAVRSAIQGASKLGEQTIQICFCQNLQDRGEA